MSVPVSGRSCDKFDEFNEESYNRQYKADRLYYCLDRFLDKYVKEGSHIIEIGAGANVPGVSFLAKNRNNVTAGLLMNFEHSKFSEDIYEPSQMVCSAQRLVAELPHAENYHCYRMAAHEAVSSNPRKADVLILNRMVRCTILWIILSLRSAS